MMSDEEKQELKEKIVRKLKETYQLTATQCMQLQDQYVEQLESEARKQLDPSKHGGNELAASMTVREVLEMERKGQ